MSQAAQQAEGFTALGVGKRRGGTQQKPQKQNPKHEVRNSKQIRMTKIQNGLPEVAL
jgi:hypothetical protein